MLRVASLKQPMSHATQCQPFHFPKLLKSGIIKLRERLHTEVNPTLYSYLPQSIHHLVLQLLE